MLKVFNVSDIVWDVDNNSEDRVYGLPARVQVTVSCSPSREDEINEIILDYLSDEYGWCIRNCSIKAVGGSLDDVVVVDSRMMED